ncbi:SubName: Full=Uncharacterized protein {ECO:0000313/EMBL:CCA67221.1} [Serendipita indica DSM 11827]|nr:SubName: Full=Uncharacterized protein {ECO:0000313/EMBL:CCA67221.1} [Serendipita indica DSM 11827]
MESSPPPVESRTLPLTAVNLRTIPRIASSIAKFVAEQRQNVRLYAADALDVPNSADVTSKRIHGNKKSSPLLKSRLEIRQAREAEAAKEAHVGSESRPAKKTHVLDQKEALYGVRDVVGAKATASRKRRRMGDGDEEYEARLEERRERKRARKAIMDPNAKMRNTGDDLDAEQSEKNDKKKEKKKRAKGALGMTLMETFTAANVKKSSRLTLPPVVGRMFKNSKAGNIIHLTGKENARTCKQDASNALRKMKKEETNPCDVSFDRLGALARPRSHQSKSWALGSQLPDEDEELEPGRSHLSRGSVGPEVQSSHSPIGVMKLPTYWNLTSKTANVGIFECPSFTHAQLTAREGIGQRDQDETLERTTASPYFVRPLVQIPARILQKEVSDQEIQDSARLKVGTPLGGDGETMRQARGCDEELTMKAIQEQVGRMEEGQAFRESPNLDEEPSFTSLDLMLRQHDEEDVLYNRTFRLESLMAREWLGNILVGVQADPQEVGYDDSVYANSVNTGSPIEDKARETCLMSEEPGDSFLGVPLDNECGEEEVVDGDAIFYSDQGNDAASMLDDLRSSNAPQVKPDYEAQAIESQSDTAGDILPFVSSQLILRGLGAPGIGERWTSQPASTLGQSVQEIEIAAARRLIGRW